MKCLSLFVLLLLLALPSQVRALGEERFGNAPVVKQPEWAEGILEVANLESRVYSQWVNGNESLFYQGNAQALAATLRKFAAVKSPERRLILLPGPGRTTSFHGKPVDFDWKLHVPSGIYRAITGDRNAVLTVHINVELPRGPVDRDKVKKWLAELDDDAFATRQNASQELEKLGASAKVLLREALKANPSAEVRRRLEAILGKLKGIDVSDLDIPPELTVVTVSDQLETFTRGLADKNPTRSGIALASLAELAPYSDRILPKLIELLDAGKNEYTRRIAAGCLARLGASAQPAIPALKKGLKDPDRNIQKAFQSALDQIDKARPEPGWDEELERRRVILKGLEEVKKGRARK